MAPRVPEALGTRLAWDGLNLVDLERSEQETAKLSFDFPLPAWAVWLQEISNAARGSVQTGKTIKLGDEAPFAELWSPFLATARAKLEARLDEGSFTSLATGVWEEFERHLVWQLADLADQCAYAAFDSFRSATTTVPAPAKSDLASDDTAAGLHPRYASFIRQTLQDGLETFFLSYPALARQLSGFTMSWVEAGVSFLNRLRSDQADLARVFNQGAELGPVVSLQAGLSDRHHGGQQVVALNFATGKKLFYKPKNLGQEAALGQLFDWFVSRGALTAQDLPPTVRVLSRTTHGWAEAVEESPARSVAEARQYYRRAGALLAFLHVLGGNDCVMDNLVATHAGPVVIDLETLFQPRAASARAVRSPGASLQGAKEFVGDSVLRTGLLPMWQRAPGGEFYDISGLAGEGNVNTGRPRLVWRSVNTDAMCPETVADQRPAQHNLLRFEGGQIIPARQHLDSVEAGYRVAVTAIAHHRDALCGPKGLLQRLFGDGWTRFILRPSYLYSVLLGDELAQPSAWQSGPERAMSMECLMRPFVQRSNPGQAPPPLWPLLRREREALERGDIPHFPIRVDAGVDLVLAGEAGGDELRVPAVLAESGLELASQRLAALDEREIEAQIGLIRAAFHRPADDRSFAALAPPESRAELEAVTPLTPEELLARAASIARKILARTVASGPDAVTWLSPDGLRLDENTLQGGNYYLYDGNCGVALFLAACSAISPGPPAAAAMIDPDLIRRACRPVEALCAPDTAARESRMKGLGVCVGLASAVYSFTRIGGFLREPEYLEAANRIAREITEERIRADRVFDVFGGAAGAILALMSLYRATDERFLLETALHCGRHLVEHQRPARRGGGAWVGTQGGMPVGFAHGAAGVAYALSRLCVAARTDEFFGPMRAALDYERAQFRPEALNWPMVSRPEDGAADSGRPVFLNAWCNGAAGIGLGRLGMLAVQDDAAMRAEIDAALRKNLLGGLPRIDFLCCGNFGRIEFLLTAGQHLTDPVAEHEAQIRAALAVRRAGEADAYSFGPDPADDQCFQPGFFRGLAGIGYQLLRLAKPVEVPSVLLFE